VVSGAVGQPTTTAAPVTCGISQSSEVVNETADQVLDRTTGVSTQRMDWASLVSTPLIHNNRFGVLATTDDEHSDGGRFEERRSVRVKCHRRQSSQQNHHDQQQQEAGGVQQPGQQTQPPRRLW